MSSYKASYFYAGAEITILISQAESYEHAEAQARTVLGKLLNRFPQGHMAPYQGNYAQPGIQNQFPGLLQGQGQSVQTNIQEGSQLTFTLTPNPNNYYTFYNVDGNWSVPENKLTEEQALAEIDNSCDYKPHDTLTNPGFHLRCGESGFHMARRPGYPGTHIWLCEEHFQKPNGYACGCPHCKEEEPIQICPITTQ